MSINTRMEKHSVVHLEDKIILTKKKVQNQAWRGSPAMLRLGTGSSEVHRPSVEGKPAKMTDFCGMSRGKVGDILSKKHGIHA